MSKVFDPTDFEEWKKLTKSISDYLREKPNSSNPAKLMHVIANTMGFENTQSFKMSLLQSQLFQFDELSHLTLHQLCVFGTTQQIVDKIRSLFKSDNIEEQRLLEEPLWLVEKLATLYFNDLTNEGDVTTFENFISFLEVNSVLGRCMDTSTQCFLEDINISEKNTYVIFELNSWYKSLPGNCGLVDSTKKSNKLTIDTHPKIILNKVSSILYPVVSRLIRHVDHKKSENIEQIIASIFTRMHEFIDSLREDREFRYELEIIVKEKFIFDGNEESNNYNLLIDHIKNKYMSYEGKFNDKQYINLLVEATFFNMNIIHVLIVHSAANLLEKVIYRECKSNNSAEIKKIQWDRKDSNLIPEKLFFIDYRRHIEF